MDRNLADVIGEISRSRKTGMLSVGLKGDPSLFKIFFRDGSIYHITHGTCRNMECIADLARLSTEAVYFMPDAHVDTVTPITTPTEEIIRRIQELGKTVRFTDRLSAAEAASPGAGSSAMVDPATLGALEEELVNIVGPVAGMLIEKVYAECGAKKDGPISKRDFRKFVECVLRQIPEDQKQRFKDKFL